MALNDLVKKIRQLRKSDPRFEGLKLRASARLVLQMEFGVQPTDAEVVELVGEAKKVARKNRNFFEDWDFEEDAEKNDQQRQTRGGKEIVYKSEHRAG